MKEYIVRYTYEISMMAKNEDEALDKAEKLFNKAIDGGNKPVNELFDIETIVEGRDSFHPKKEIV